MGFTHGYSRAALFGAEELSARWRIRSPGRHEPARTCFARSVIMGLRPTKLDENGAGADSVLWSLRFPEGTCRTMRQGCGAVHDVPLRGIADSTKRSLRQPSHYRRVVFRPCGFSARREACVADLPGQAQTTSLTGIT